MPTYWLAEWRSFVRLLDVRINLEPIGKGRPRVTRQGRAYTPKATRDWEQAAAAVLACAWAGAGPIDTPCEVLIRAYKRRPKHYRKSGAGAGPLWAPKKPDIDNVAKAVLDALTLAGVWTDDALVCRLLVEKLECAHGVEPCVEVVVSALQAIH